MKLDNTDKKLINLLQEDSKRTNKHLSLLLNLSVTAVFERIKKLERAEGTWEMAENLYELLANRVNDLEWDVKDLNREINY